MTPENILPTYERIATGFDRTRDKSLFERKWLDKMLAHTHPPRRVLDIGCGSGNPIARYLYDRRAKITGLDGAAAMIALFQQVLPDATVVHGDMRQMELGQSFDAILAWNSFFHLSSNDQRAMFPRFAAHAHPGTVLMFTAGPSAGEPIGNVQGEPVYHASLDPDEYKQLLHDNGFELLQFAPDDPTCRGHTIWLARASKSI